MVEKIIYDIGSNNGDDIPYYLLKADKVVAVEANPDLARGIEQRFAKEILSGCLFVENCVITVDSSAKAVPFYIHKTNHVQSQFLAPPPGSDLFQEVLLPSKNIIEIIERHGKPYYIKIDIEGYDQYVLKHLFLHSIRPPYISAESHSIDIFCWLVSLGEYSAFKLVDGHSISTKYADHSIDSLGGKIKYAFPYHSAGPFGNDIGGRWMTRDIFFSLLAYAKLGWKDIHASNVDAPDQQYAPQPVVSISINF
jgi:FkbM family methyltransferase